MRKNPISESGSFTPRLLLGCALVGMSALLAALSFAANPSSGTISPSGPALTWVGTGTGVPPAAGGPESCSEADNNCDSYTLTISGTPADCVG